MTDDVTALRKEVDDLHDEVERLKRDLNSLRTQSHDRTSELAYELDRLDRCLKDLEAK